MIKRRLWVAIAALAITALAAPSSASAAWVGPQQGAANKTPWSGYWWPMLSTSTNLYDNGGPLQKYDSYLQNTTGTRGGAQAWEQRNHATHVAANNWWGHCHAWAAASILTNTPPANFNAGGQNWTTNDTKGLVTELYYTPKHNWLSGRRVDNPNDTTSEAYKDIAPAWMDYLLQYYVSYHKYPFIMDISANSEVWNFPVYAYRRWTWDNADGSQHVYTQVWFSSPEYNITGHKYITRTYTYLLKPGTLGQWTGDSVKDHPDFAWVPTGKTNPAHVDLNTVNRITGMNIPAG
jgi:hypothetical protein